MDLFIRVLTLAYLSSFASPDAQGNYFYGIFESF